MDELRRLLNLIRQIEFASAKEANYAGESVTKINESQATIRKATREIVTLFGHKLDREVRAIINEWASSGVVFETPDTADPIGDETTTTKGDER